MTDTAVATVVAPGTVLRGEVRCAGDLRVMGRIEGEVSCGGMLVLEAGGVIEAAVRARSAVLAGRMRGDVSVVEEAELAETCRLLGDLRAARVKIAPGAAVRGRVELGDAGADEEEWNFDEEETPAAPPLAALEKPTAAVLEELETAPRAAREEPRSPLAAALEELAAREAAGAEEPRASGPADAVAETAIPAAPSEPAAEPAGAAGAVAEVIAEAGEVLAGSAGRPPPPRPPASALALGVRSQVVLKE